MELENPNTVLVIDQIAALSPSIGPRIWKIHGEAVNGQLLNEELSSSARFIAEFCLSLWSPAYKVSASDIFKLDPMKFYKFVSALRLLHGSESVEAFA